MKQLISCDWGTSSFRLRLVATDGQTRTAAQAGAGKPAGSADAIGPQTILAEVSRPLGIASTFEAWKQSGQTEENRLSFYLSVLKDRIAALEEMGHASLRGLPLVISGMASANIGMLELPYKELPFRADGRDLHTLVLEATEDFNHEVILISGGKTDRDVMRGEETQLAGCIPAKAGNPARDGVPATDDLSATDEGGRLFIFPGTHSKHIFVKGQTTLSFRTFMTGEFFSLLSRNSILSGSILANTNPLEDAMLKSFEDGVSEAMHTNLLNSAFFVRTNSLFDKYTKQENYYYLSGLLIGTELKNLSDPAIAGPANPPIPVTIVGDRHQQQYYLAALRKLGIPGVQFQDAAQAVVNGHCRIYEQYKSSII
jgi:2-dehydro-3-deoxygalactonokinase